MHQPYYKNPEDKKFEMPWVFLHGIKDYYDMPWLCEKYGVKVTFNLVPSLLAQIEEYSDIENCRFLSTWIKPIDKLSIDEKKYLFRYLFSSNLENMIKPIDRYYQLFLKKHRTDEDHIVDYFSDQELLDLEVLFILSWCGNYLRQNSETVIYLLDKAKGYTQEDKEDLLSELQNFLKNITQLYKRLLNEKKIEITTSPFYHPILPLLIDMNVAKESCQEMHIPKVKENLSNFAYDQVDLAVGSYRSTFGKTPKGVWSSEGSLSMETLKLFGEFNFLWTATDEDILFNSLSKRDLNLIYKVWENQGIKIFFRDKYLSDSIGFRYFKMNWQVAVKDFMDRLYDIYKKSDYNPVVSIVLDGENAWEFYKNNGIEFLSNLYSQIKKTSWIKTVTFSEVLDKDVEFSNLKTLKAGSWIYSNFKTWVCHTEKNTAWEYLDRAVGFYRKNQLEEAKDYLMISMGSDWFWWYGDDHYTPFSDIFDNLFRANLKRVYKSAGLNPPVYLDKPIKKKSKSQILKKPTYYISPNINGKVDNYFEWLYSGELDMRFDMSSMSLSINKFERLFYGYDKENLYLLIYGKFQEGDNLKINFYTQREIALELPIKRSISQINFEEKIVYYGFDSVLEVKIPLKIFDFSEKIEFFLELVKDGISVEKVPIYSNFEIGIENFDFEWMV